jgi:hypothetical protein
MKNDSPERNMHFESMLWRNELEYHLRELAIFESYLLNKEGRIQPYKLTALMSQLHQYVQSINKLLDEIRPVSKIMPLATHAGISTVCESKGSQQYIREEIFYFEQSYRQFKHSFCSFAEGLEVA